MQVIEMKWIYSKSAFSASRRPNGARKKGSPPRGHDGISVGGYRAIAVALDREVQVWQLTPVVKEIINNKNNLKKSSLHSVDTRKNLAIFQTNS